MPLFTIRRTHCLAFASCIVLSILLACPTARALSASTTKLAVSSNSVASGSAVTLTATVTTGSQSVHPGLVNFCNASASHCTGSALLAQAQLTSAGTARTVLHLAPGSHSILASFAGTSAVAASSSAAQTVTVTGGYPSAVTSQVSGATGNNTVVSTVQGFGGQPVTGVISLVDSSNGNLALGSGTLGASTTQTGFITGATYSVGSSPDAVVIGDLNGDGWPDLVASNLYSGSISIFLGQLNGSSAAAPTITGLVSPTAVALGDFNSDGKLDIAVTSGVSYNVTILLGNGDGTFTALPQTPATGVGPNSIVVTDLNRDGIPDLAIANQDGSVTILLGNGDGTFHPSSQALAAGSFPMGIATGDFNNDGKADLAVTNMFDNDVTVFLGNGDGTFFSSNTENTGVYPLGVTVADFNSDGNQDIAVSNSFSNTITILLGNGKGAFTAASTPPSTGTRPVAIVPADFNNDGIPDLAVAVQGANAATIFYGKGDGTFPKTQTVTGLKEPGAIAAGDFLGLGWIDLALANSGGATAETLINSPVSSASATIQGVRVQGGGSIQVAAQYGGNTTYGSSTGSFPLAGQIIPTSLTVSFEPSATVALGETVQVNAQLTPSLVGTLTPGGTVSFFSGTTALGVATPVNGVGVLDFTATAAGTETISARYSGDLNFATSSASGNVTVVNPTASTTTLSLSATSVAHGTPITFTANVSSGGKPVTRGTVRFCYSGQTCQGSFLLGQAQLTANGTASLKTALKLGAFPVNAIFAGTSQVTGSASAAQTVTTTGTYPTTTTIASQGTTGNYTLVGTVTGSSGIPFLSPVMSFEDASDQNFAIAANRPATTAATFLNSASLPANNMTSGVATGDFNGDGKQDFASVGGAPGDLVVELGNGNGTFAAKPSTIALGAAVSIVAGDFNNDGKLDLAVAEIPMSAGGGFASTPGDVKILLGNGDGTFTVKTTVLTGDYPYQMAVADFNRDGNLDIAVANESSQSMTILLGNGNGTFIADPAPPSLLASAVVAADFNGDSVPDLAVIGTASGSVEGGVLILLGNGDGTFTVTPTVYLPNSGETGLVAAGFTNSGNTDLAAIGDHTVTILKNVGKGNFTTSMTPTTVTNNVFVGAAADFDESGFPGLVLTSAGNGPMTLLIPTGTATYTQTTLTLPGTNSASALVALGDFDGDGISDFVASDINGNLDDVFLSRSRASTTLTGVAVPGGGPQNVLAAYTGSMASVYTLSSSGTIPLQGTPEPAPVIVTTNAGSYLHAKASFQVNVAVQPVDNYSATGTVFIYLDSALLTTQTLTGGSASVVTSIATAGTHTLSARYTGNTNIAASNSLPVSVFVVPASTTTLTASANSIPTGTVLTLTASVISGGAQLTSGVVNFCTAGATSCTGDNFLGTAQLGASGSAVLRLRPGIGSQSYVASFAGSNTAAPGTSTAVTVAVTGLHATTTTLTSAVAGATYTLTAKVAGASNIAPAGSVSFVDTSNNNQVLGTATLSTGVSAIGFTQSALAAPNTDNYSVVTGDFNNDGKPDYAMLNTGSTLGAAVFLGNGAGGFTQSALLATSSSGASIAAGDFNADGKQDIVLTSSTQVIVFLGNGNGTFSAGVAAATMQNTEGLAVADFNHDGKLDIAVAGASTGDVEILLGDGTGKFTASTVSLGSQQPVALAVGDFNGDGNPDLAVGTVFGPVDILLGAGNGAFTVASSPLPGSNVVLGLAVGDFNRDGKLDLAVALETGNRVQILIGNGNGTFTQGSSIAAPGNPTQMVATDFNLDGNLDLVASDAAGNTVNLLQGNGAGGFTETTVQLPGPVCNECAQSFGLAIADFNGDGEPDVVVAQDGLGQTPLMINALNDVASATISGVKFTGTAKQNVVGKFAASTIYAASTSAALSLAPNP